MITGPTTVSALLVQAGRQLRGAGIDAGDARALLAYVLEVPRDRLVLMGSDSVSEDQASRFQACLCERLNRRPVSKITGSRLFWGRTFHVTSDVLDPRPETEILIEAALATPGLKSTLDLGVGTGCIPLTLLAEISDLRATACDISPPALKVAAANAARLGVSDRVDFITSDWFSEVTGCFDLITSNPPYISEAEMTDLSPEVWHHDPHLALPPGGDGLGPYRILAGEGQKYLRAGGRILVEIGWRQGRDVVNLFQDASWCGIEILPDLDGRDRVVSAYKPG
jgi:release factor glutamine methyltransferase